MPIGEFRKIVEALGKNGCGILSITGGEPLLLGDILERVEIAKKHIPLVTLGTNGSLLTKELIRKFEKAGLDFINISIDGIGKGHDKIRGAEGAYEKALQAIKACAGTKIGVCVNTVVSKWNVSELAKLLELTKKIGVYHKFQPVLYPPAFEDIKQDHRMNKKEMEQLKEFVKIAKSSRRVLNTRAYLDSMEHYFSAKDFAMKTDSSCLLPAHHLEVDEDSNYYLCSRFGYGELDFVGSLEELLKSSRYQGRVWKLRSCRECKESMPFCLDEPQYYIPITNFIKYHVLKMS
jgi:MoaA/NifB/PqqE/SkfB family radical SAM enzyme